MKNLHNSAFSFCEFEELIFLCFSELLVMFSAGILNM